MKDIIHPMKLFLIKLGKAWAALKRDGLVRGVPRVWRAFFGLFRRVVPGDVLFITNGVGDSARYRTGNVAEELRRQGLHTAETVQDNPFLVSYADHFSVFVFHRVLFTPMVAKFLQRIKEQHKEIIFETDDLVYDPLYLRHMDYYANMNPFERKLYEHGVGGEILNDPYVTTCTTTTEFLAEKLRELGKKVFVVPNRLSVKDVEWAENVLKHRASLITHPTSVIRIGYLSGTPSHNKDFATITKPLSTLLARHTHVRLVLAGPLDTDEALSTFSSQIERIPFMARQEYFAMVATLDINVAPLEVGNPFCEAKSELKFFEAGIVAVPTVASATGTFVQAITDGVDGFVALTEAEWTEKLERLIMDKALREQMGRQAREKVLRTYTTINATHEEYYHYISSKLTK